MTSPSIACIVEGHGEVEAVPILIRQIAGRIDPALPVIVRRPLRVSRSQLVPPEKSNAPSS